MEITVFYAIYSTQNSTEFQQNVAGRILHQLLMWYPPGTSAAMRNTYEQTLRLIGGNATFGLSVVSNVMWSVSMDVVCVSVCIIVFMLVCVCGGGGGYSVRNKEQVSDGQMS